MDKPRPRTLSTLQLATQKLKLRSLERIIGCNINICKQQQTTDGETNDKEDGLVFYSLHHNFDEPAYYCSEKLPLHLQRQKWAEIVWKCPEITKSNQNCVCVKVWLSKKKLDQFSTHCSLFQQKNWSEHHKNCAKSAFLTTGQRAIANSNVPEPPDKLIFSWAVYFSGLNMISQHADVMLSQNSLIFQLNGAYFSSPDRFTILKPEEQLTPTYQRQTMSLSAPTTPFQINTSQADRIPYPAISQSQRNAQRDKKDRLLQLHFPPSAVRSSYDLNSLLKIQEKIRLRLQKTRESNDIISEVKHLSVRCVTKNELQRRSRSTSTSFSSSNYHHQLQSHSMGRTLSILLSEQKHVEPASLLKAKKLQQQLEAIRNKHELLLLEQAAFRTRNHSLRSRLVTLKAARKQLETGLETKVNQLLIEKTALSIEKQQHFKQLQLRRHVAEHMERRMTSLCLELQEIYPIRRNSHGFYTVSGIPFPNLDTYAKHSTSQNSNSSINSEHISPVALSASLGYVAHLAQMISVILDQPLRNPIIHEGSRSRIQDVIKEVPYGPREFPLYSRSLIPSKLVRYAIFLLNQNIAQLCFEITGINCDLRDTIENLLRIFSTFSKLDQNFYEGKRLNLRTHPSDRLNIKQCITNGSITTKTSSQEIRVVDRDDFSKIHASVDMGDLNADISSSSVAICCQMRNGNKKTRYRCSRSVGSCSDSEIDNFKIVKQPCFNSDSNIQFCQRQT